MNEGIQKFKANQTGTSLRSAHKAPESPYKWFRRSNDDTFYSAVEGITNDEANKGRNDFPDIYIPDGYVDVLKPEGIVKTGMLHGSCMIAFESPFCIEVDTIAEFELLEYEIQKNRFEIYDYLKGKYSKEENNETGILQRRICE